jgi:hypothetical protein
VHEVIATGAGACHFKTRTGLIDLVELRRDDDSKFSVPSNAHD